MALSDAVLAIAEAMERDGKAFKGSAPGAAIRGKAGRMMLEDHEAWRRRQEARDADYRRRVTAERERQQRRELRQVLATGTAIIAILFGAGVALGWWLVRFGR